MIMEQHVDVLWQQQEVTFNFLRILPLTMWHETPKSVW